MGDILKEAIADAKAVRETALENAKMALEEAFTPQLKSMLSAKLKEEDLEEDEIPAEEAYMEGEDDEDEAEEGRHDAEEGMHDDEEDAEEGMHEDNIIEIDGVKYAPVMSEEEDDEKEETRHEEDLDLESVIKELESELDEGAHEDEDDKEETVEEEFEIDESLFEEEDDKDDKEETVDEVDTSSAIGKGTGRGNTDTSSGIGKANKKLKEAQSELKEYKEAVKFLKDKLHEVNILNAKLLFTNKLFKEFALSNDQKLKVVENFDRAHTTREIKLVYATLCEGFGQNNNIRKKSITEVASAKAGSTRPSKKVITESDAIAERFKKLANIR